MLKFLLVLLITSSTAHADSVLLLNLSQNRVEMSRNSDQTRSIASITKLMTAMVALDHDKNLDQQLMLTKRVKSHLPRQKYTREQLLNAMLIKSDNAAAETLAENYPGGRKQFIVQMNQQAKNWGLNHTQFADASGLSSQNVSTVRDVANLTIAAASYWFIREAGHRQQLALETKYKKKIQVINLSHTSGALLFAFDRVVVSKTGLTSAAGWCVSMLAEQNNQQYVIVVLGSKNKRERLNTVNTVLYNHVIDANLQSPDPSNNY